MDNQNFKQRSDDTLLVIWNKATIVNGYDPAQYRKDLAGAWISWKEYGKNSELGLGWEVDHRKPVSAGGTNNIDNLRPLQWQNNRSKGDDYPKWESSVSSNGDQNIYHAQSWEIN